ncbi:plant U-box 24 [Prunus dulcis]|uniref:Plant U-box 24 n=1 Tax=Prunus dulcis TaxID=3755 RepID=A0A4Y1RED0_PRUDU|nr:plant U-box 24 [Prunus dulcis]
MKVVLRRVHRHVVGSNRSCNERDMVKRNPVAQPTGSASASRPSPPPRSAAAPAAGKWRFSPGCRPKFVGSDLPPPAAISGDPDRTIVSDPTVRSEPNLQDECPIRYRTHRNFRIGVWRSWSPWARLTRVRVV